MEIIHRLDLQRTKEDFEQREDFVLLTFRRIGNTQFEFSIVTESFQGGVDRFLFAFVQIQFEQTLESSIGQCRDRLIPGNHLNALWCSSFDFAFQMFSGAFLFLNRNLSETEILQLRQFFIVQQLIVVLISDGDDAFLALFEPSGQFILFLKVVDRIENTFLG